jgi:hypothetical protein
MSRTLALLSLKIPPNHFQTVSVASATAEYRQPRAHIMTLHAPKNQYAPFQGILRDEDLLWCAPAPQKIVVQPRSDNLALSR